MSALLLSFLGISMGIPHCPEWREIAPCTCRVNANLTTIHCNMMKSYDEVVTLLGGRFTRANKVYLQLTFSKLDDLPFRSFNELNMTIQNLKLNNNNLGYVKESSFESLSKVLLFSLADNPLGYVPEHLWSRMPKVGTIDLGRAKIRSLSSSNFKNLLVTCIILAGNQISSMDRDTFPSSVQRLHIGRNKLRTLNETLVGLSQLIWLFVNSNELTSVEGELPSNAKSLKLIHLSHNYLERLPSQMNSLPALDSLFFQHNRIRRLEGILAKARNLIRVVLEHNNIDLLTPDDFVENENLKSLLLGHNFITSLNNSLLNLKNLNFLNMTNNLLTEFAFQEIMGLQELRSIDLSYNKIRVLIGPGSNLVEWNIKLAEIKLNNNEIEDLNGALSGLPELLRLNLSFNKLLRISPDDLIGLDQLRLLDVSHNFLTTLEETSKTFLPRLEELRASHNHLTILEKDFHGLPVLCHADLSNNQIVSLGRDLVSRTRCKVGHGLSEGTWDTLRINLQDNPILCDAALPEISAAMEVNHTRIYGLAHCAPAIEGPITISDSNGFVDYNPEANLGNDTNNQNLAPNGLPSNPTIVDLSKNDQYSVEAPVDNRIQSDAILQPPPEPFNTQIQQEKQITKLASEIKELRSRVDELAEQSHLLLRQQFPNMNANNSEPSVKNSDKPSEPIKP